MPARHFIVSGCVQGVCYRLSTQEQAIRLQLRGWVRNLSDGRVELVADGATGSLAQMQAWLWKGPPLAQVEQVIVEQLPDQNNYDRDLSETFEIR